LPVVFIDTAGLREARDEIEQEGIRRSHETVTRAEFVLHVLDASEALTDEDQKFLNAFAGKKRILIRNKVDLPNKLYEFRAPTADSRIVDVCCLSGQGIESLKDAIKEQIWRGEIGSGMLEVMINSRHQEALNRARAALQRAIELLRNNATLELVALDLRIGVSAVGEIVGKTATEDLLNCLFGQFCIGK
jgi:tRNA modification GTPase